jgi:FkbM family methyltransferase
MPPELPAAPLWVRATARVVRGLPLGRYRLLHALPQTAAPFWAWLPVEGYRFRCDLRDSISREVCFTGQYEPQETALIRALLAPGMTFVDVGANWGYHSLVAARLVGPGGRVVCLEPEPRLFEVLAGNVSANGLAGVTCLPLAAAESPGEVLFATYQESGGNYGVSRIVGEQAAAAGRVAARPLDAILDELAIERVDLVKMDIEGAEASALRGLRARLAGGRVGRLLLELHPRELAEQGDSVQQVLDDLRGHGYAGWWIDHSPAATRRAAYGRRDVASTLLKPMGAESAPDSWPHTLWLAPGETLPHHLLSGGVGPPE